MAFAIRVEGVAASRASEKQEFTEQGRGQDEPSDIAQPQLMNPRRIRYFPQPRLLVRDRHRHALLRQSCAVAGPESLDPQGKAEHLRNWAARPTGGDGSARQSADGRGAGPTSAHSPNESAGYREPERSEDGERECVPEGPPPP